MHRILSLSVFAGLALGAVGVASAQSRTVSTADMPKPGVSYISGPSAPVRRETVSTGTLPQPARLYVDGQANSGGYPDQGGYGNGGYDNQAANDGGGGYYSGGYGSYPNNDSYGYGHDHDHGGYPGHGHGGGHDGNGYQQPGNSVSVGMKANPPNGRPAVQVAPPRQARDGGHRGNNGWNPYPQPIPVTNGVNANRASEPGTGISTGNQPGTGIPLRGGGGNGYGR
ncbi:MAG TPA: hypothetical protein VM621_00225 [Luteibacter sp.]|uniref:hypothetical protein n=1 Tax=Luteibacter sp. TaxID=1886636 RepID=UPI002C0F3F4A|nr:hypothetical protein [Luteibacter sp.]HVI53460.1 hypothetical protein [Luteibacter sp.]